MTDPCDVDEVIVIIGGRGRLSSAEGILAAQSFISSQQHYRNAQFAIAISGYDEKLDEVWKLPEIIDYITLVLSEIAKTLGDDITAWRLCQDSATMIAVILSNGLIQQ
jgi:hypothetical protein